MRIPILDDSNYSQVQQMKKIEEEFGEVGVEFWRMNKEGLITELFDLIQASMTMLQVLNASEQDLYRHYKKLECYEAQGKINIKGYAEIKLVFPDSSAQI